MSGDESMSDDLSARLGLPYLAAGQMQKHVTLNEALTRLDALVHAAVASRTTTAQPSAPADGALWILPPDATGADWGGRAAGTLMRAESGGWTEVVAPDGLVVLVQDAGDLMVRDLGAWAPVGARLGAVQSIDRLGLGTTADAANPFSARLNAALWTALDAGSGGTGDLRLTLNKEAPGDVLSLLFQSGWSGRAELGLVGDDDLRLKVSADGSEWREVMAVDRTTGRASFARGAGRRETTVFTADGAYEPPAWARTIEAVVVAGGGGGGGGDSGASGARFGGGGGGAGGISGGRWAADALTDGLTVVVGAGGAGGSSGAGAAGGQSAVVHDGEPVLTALGGGGGLAGSVGGGAGPGGLGLVVSNAGGASRVDATAAAGGAFERPDGSGGGGAGGGLDATDTARAGGAGGAGGVLARTAAGGGGGSGGAGSNGVAAPQPSLHPAGGGGGGGGAVASGTGHPGGAGGAYGAGGGGGGAGVSAGGAGGPGADGVVWLTAVG
jgi:hypothetical protein